MLHHLLSNHNPLLLTLPCLQTLLLPLRICMDASSTRRVDISRKWSCSMSLGSRSFITTGLVAKLLGAGRTPSMLARNQDSVGITTHFEHFCAPYPNQPQALLASRCATFCDHGYGCSKHAEGRLASSITKNRVLLETPRYIAYAIPVPGAMALRLLLFLPCVSSI